MGESFIVRRGGGTGKAFAFINVHYPEGSICTCSDGTKTLRADDTSGTFVFTIPKAGDWTVECHNGEGKSNSKTVSITQKYTQEEVILAYEFLIYTNGVQNVELKSAVNTNGAVQFNDTNIRMTYSGTSSRNATIYTKNPIDVTPFSTLFVEISVTDVDTAMRYGLREKPLTTFASGDLASGWLAVQVDNGVASRRVVEIDISSVSGLAYFQASTSIAKCYIYRIWVGA